MEKACQLSRSGDARRPDREIGLGRLAPVNIPPPSPADNDKFDYFWNRANGLVSKLTTALTGIVGFFQAQKHMM